MIEGINGRPPAMDPAAMKQMRTQMFDKLDANKDGAIDAAELAAVKEQGASEGSEAIGAAKPRRNPADLLEKIGADGDGDGKITREEYTTAFDAFDEKMKSKLIEAQSQASAALLSANDSSSSNGTSLADLFKQLDKKIEDEKAGGQSTELQDLGERLAGYLQKLLQKS